MIIKSKAGTEIAKNGYTVIDELNQIPMIKTNYLQLEHNHINPIILGSKAFEHKDIFVNVVEDTETSGDTAFKEYNAIHEFAWVLSGMRKHDSYTGYLSLEQYLTLVLEGTEFTYQVEGGHQYYALQFENLGDGESHLDMFFKMLNRWNTEFELRGKKVYITHQRGRLRDKHVGRYKMNIIDTIINSDITDGATAVWGYFGKKDEENPENSTYREFYWQIDELVEQYGIRYAKPYSNENITQEETMIEYLNNILLDSWKISTEVDIAEITDEVAQTGDEYVAVDERLGITLNTRIQKLESVYDADDKLLYQTATLGTVSFANTSSGSSSQLQEVIEKVKKDYNDRITDLKQEFDNRFNDEVTQIEIDFNELVNGVRQEIQADKEAFELQYEADKEALSGEIQDSYDNAVTEANRIVEAKATDFKKYADGIGSAANGRIDSLYEGFGDLSSEFESLEIGGRNLLIDSDFKESSNRFTYQRLDLERNGIELIATNDIVSTTSYPRILYKPLGNLEVGKQYTISFKAKSGGEPFSADFWVSTASGGSRQITPQKPHYTEQWKKYEYTITINENFSDETAIQWWVNATNPTTKQTLHLKEIQLEKGNKATDWTPAPEDADQKLTIIANDLDGIQTKVENNTGAITTVTQQANGLERRVENAEGNITTVTELANGIQQRVTDAEGNINTITNLANGTQQTVTNMLDGKATKGTVFQNTVDGFLNRVWQTDIDNLEIGGRNLILESRNIAIISNNTISYPIETDNSGTNFKFRRALGSSNTALSTYTTKFFTAPEEGVYTQSVKVKPDSDIILRVTSSEKEVLCKAGEWTVLSVSFNLTAGQEKRVMGIYSYSNDFEKNNPWIEYKEWKVEKGSKATDWSPAPEDLMKYTDIIARPDGFLIGSFEMGGDKIAQAIVGKAGAIDLIADNVNFTGSVNVANQIKAYSLEAVYADIDKLRTNILTANSVEANALKVDTALINKLNTNSILTNYLIANTAMIENIKSKSLEAVYADISELRTRLLVADVITADMLKADTAMFEKFTSSTAFINSLTAKSAFISNIKAIDIDFNRATATGLNGSNTLLITADRIEQRGQFNRRYHGKTYNYDVTTTMRGGYLRFGDNTQQRAINISAFGISTYLDGDGEWAGSPGSSGYIQWWDDTYSPSNANGITMGSYNVVALKSDNNRVVIDAEASVSIESKSAPLYLYPYKRDRPGVNRFNFTTSDTNDPTQVHGYIMYGAGDGSYKYGVGLRFNKNQNTNLLQVVDGNFASSSQTQLEVGTLWAFDVRDRSTNSYYYKNGTSGRNIDDGVNPRGQLQSTSMVTNRGDRDMYLGTRGGAVHITDERGQNTSGTTRYMDIQFQNWKANSYEYSKYDIHDWNTSVLDVFRNSLKLKKFKLIADRERQNEVLIHSGIVVRDNSNLDEFPVEWRSGTGFDGNEVMWWNTKAIQELAYENDTLKSEIAELKSQINKIMEMIA